SRARERAARISASTMAGLAGACGTIFLAARCVRREETGAPPREAPPGSATEGKNTMTFPLFSAAPPGQTQPLALAKHEGKGLRVVNTAAHCGYTPQYRPLGEVDRKYKDRGFAVVGFVSDDFGRQAGTVAEIQACSLDNRATFDQFSEMHAKKGP